MMQGRSPIANAFGENAETYDESGFIQRHVAGRLSQFVLSETSQLGDVLEVGCGTGVLTSFLIDHSDSYVLSDLSPQMVSVALSRFPSALPLVVDALNPCFTASFDVIVTSLTLHWVPDVKQVLQQLSACLKPGGKLFFSCFGSNSYYEWRTAHAMEDAPCGLQDFPILGQVKDALPSTGQRQVWEEWVREEGVSAGDFLHSLKVMGAHVPHKGHTPLPASLMRRVMKRFDRTPNVSYQVIYGKYIQPTYWSDE